MTYNPRVLFRRLWRDRRGVAGILAAGAVAATFGLAGIVIDLGNVYHAHRKLQAATDAAALAGAMDINCCSSQPGKAISSATAYSGVSGNQNADANLPTTMVSGYPQLKCFSSTGVSCAGPDNANAIVVKQQASVPLFFGPIVGVSSIQMTAAAVAGSNGGTMPPADVVVILDTTASMNTTDSHCAIANSTRLSCAFAGLRSLLSGFTPPQQQVAMMVFPGLTNATQAQYEYDCSTSPQPTVAPYNQNPAPTYLVVPFSTDYKSGSSLNTSSNLVKAARGGASGCTQGVSAIGGQGTFYAAVVTAAQTYLTNNGRSGVAKYIILISDGDAQSGSAPNTSQECHQAITAAQNAHTAGTTVVTVAYGAATSSSCSTDTSPIISACDALRQMATNTPQWFYSDTQGGTTACNSSAHSVSDLNSILPMIGTGMSGARMLSDNTT